MSLNFNLPTAIVTAIALPLFFYVLKRVREFLKENLSLALDAVFWFLGRIFVHSLATRLSLKRYCRIKLGDATNRYLQVPGRSPTALETDQIFVPLELEPRQGVTGDQSSPFTGGGRVRIIGDPGSGKSSFVKQMFRSECRRGESARRRENDIRLPIVLELKQLVPPVGLTTEAAAGKWLLDELRKSVEDVRGFEMSKLFDSYLSGAGITALLDGLDEVASDNYPGIENAIKGLSAYLATQSDKNLTVLTMRVQFHQQVHAAFDADFPVVLKISPFDPSDIFQFLERWPFKADRFREMSRIYADLTDRPTLREMCSNPLVLAMYVANDQDLSAHHIADTRTSFYNEVVEELLVMRRSRQLGTAARTTLREQREEILGKMALENLLDDSQPANSLAWDKAVGITQETLGCDDRNEAERHLQGLAKDTGIISEERAEETLRFIHLTFCEFLAAKEAAVGQKGGWEHLLQSHSVFKDSEQPQVRSRLNEVIPFSSALLPRSQRSDAIAAVAKLTSADILGRCFLETQAYSGATWERYLSDERRSLMESTSENWTAEWLSRLHLFNVVLHDAEEWSGLSGKQLDLQLTELFADLVGTDRDRLVRLFSSYALNDPGAALRLSDDCGVDLAEEYPELIIKNCDFPPFLVVAIQRAIGEEPTSHRWRILLAEAGLRGTPLAALTMNEHESPKSLTKQVRALPASSVWAPLRQAFWMTSENSRKPPSLSCYSTFLTLVLSDKARIPKGMKALDALSRVPAPGSLRSSMWARAAWLLLMIFGFGLIWMEGQHVGALGTVIYLVLLVFVTQPVLSYPTSRTRLYSAAANVSWLPMNRTMYELRHDRTRGKRLSFRAIVYNVRAFTNRFYLPRLNKAVRELSYLRFGEEAKFQQAARDLPATDEQGELATS